MNPVLHYLLGRFTWRRDNGLRKKVSLCSKLYKMPYKSGDSVSIEEYNTSSPEAVANPSALQTSSKIKAQAYI